MIYAISGEHEIQQKNQGPLIKTILLALEIKD